MLTWKKRMRKCEMRESRYVFMINERPSMVKIFLDHIQLILIINAKEIKRLLYNKRNQFRHGCFRSKQESI
jgi:hypothetical protein